MSEEKRLPFAGYVKPRYLTLQFDDVTIKTIYTASKSSVLLSSVSLTFLDSLLNLTWFPCTCCVKRSVGRNGCGT